LPTHQAHRRIESRVRGRNAEDEHASGIRIGFYPVQISKIREQMNPVIGEGESLERTANGYFADAAMRNAISATRLPTPLMVFKLPSSFESSSPCDWMVPPQ